MEEKENNVNTERVESNINKLSMQNPFIFAFLTASILLISILLSAILRTLFTINISAVLPPIIHFISIIALGLIYKQIYNEKLSKDLIFKTALYSSVVVLIFISIIGVLLFTIKQFAVGGIFLLIGLLGSLVNFVFVSLNLNISNFISLNAIKLPKKLTLVLQSDEEIILKPKRSTFKLFILNLIAFILLGVFWYFMGHEIFVKLGTWSIVVTICVFIFLIIDTADMLFLSEFILTNKRLIKRRYLLYNFILLTEMESLTLNQTLDFGFISILSKNGDIFKSPMIANPNEIKIEIEKYINNLNIYKD